MKSSCRTLPVEQYAKKINIFVQFLLAECQVAFEIWFDLLEDIDTALHAFSKMLQALQIPLRLYKQIYCLKWNFRIQLNKGIINVVS